MCFKYALQCLKLMMSSANGQSRHSSSRSLLSREEHYKYVDFTINISCELFTVLAANNCVIACIV